MNRRPLVLFSLATVVGMALLSVWAWGQLPADAQVPIHWGIDGRADGFASKEIALAMLPIAALVLTGILAIAPSIEPRRTNFERSMKLYSVVWIGVIALFVGIHVAMIAIALGNDIAMDRLILVGIGVMFVGIGNYLPKTRSTFLMGIRTPWTLTSERSWTRTHRVGGYGFVALGLVMLALGVVGMTGIVMVAVILGGVLILVSGLFVLSYLVWRNDPDRTTLDGRPG